jgi:hypothetical protein
MRSSVAKVAMAWVLICSCLTAAGCAGDDSGNADAGAGTGGAGGSGGAGGGSGGPTEAGGLGCVEELPVACPDPPVKYSQVEPIFKRSCVSVCHNGTTPDPNNNNLPIWGFTDHEHVVSWQDTIRDHVFRCSMPPQDAGVAMTQDDRRAILAFIRCGSPQ